MLKFALALLALVSIGRAQEGSAETVLAQAVKSPGITVVHLWAPWCPNCKAEITGGGWSHFISASPDVKFVFVTVWSEDPGTELLKKYGLAGAPNLTVLVHPNASRKDHER